MEKERIVSRKVDSQADVTEVVSQFTKVVSLALKNGRIVAEVMSQKNWLTTRNGLSSTKACKF